jgi:hypothetical protein
VRTSVERTCVQCGTTFCSTRNDARLCSARCRKRHERGTSPTASGPLKAFLERHGFAHEGTLSVAAGVAMAELNAALKLLHDRGLRTVIQPFTDATFRAALRDARVAAA